MPHKRALQPCRTLVIDTPRGVKKTITSLSSDQLIHIISSSRDVTIMQFLSRSQKESPCLLFLCVACLALRILVACPFAGEIFGTWVEDKMFRETAEELAAFGYMTGLTILGTMAWQSRRKEASLDPGELSAASGSRSRSRSGDRIDRDSESDDDGIWDADLCVKLYIALFALGC